MKTDIKELQRKDTLKKLKDMGQIFIPMSSKEPNTKRLTKIVLDLGLVFKGNQVTQKTLKEWGQTNPKKLEAINNKIIELIVKGSITSWGIIPTNDLIVIDVDLTKGDKTADVSIVDLYDIKNTYFENSQMIINKSKHGFRIFGINKDHLDIEQSVKTFNLQFIDHQENLINKKVDIRGGKSSSLLAMQNSNHDYSNLFIFDEEKDEPIISKKFLDDNDFSRPNEKEELLLIEDKYNESIIDYERKHDLFIDKDTTSLRELKINKVNEKIQRIEEIKKANDEKPKNKRNKKSRFAASKGFAIAPYVLKQIEILIDVILENRHKHSEDFYILDMNEDEQDRTFFTAITILLQRLTMDPNDKDIEDMFLHDEHYLDLKEKGSYKGYLKEATIKNNQEIIDKIKKLFEKTLKALDIKRDEKYIPDMIDLALYKIKNAKHNRIKSNHLGIFIAIFGNNLDFNIKNANDYDKKLKSNDFGYDKRYDFINKKIEKFNWVRLPELYNSEKANKEILRLLHKDELINGNFSKIDDDFGICYEGFKANEIESFNDIVVADEKIPAFMNPNSGLNSFKRYAINKVTPLDIKKNENVLEKIIKYIDMIQGYEDAIEKEYEKLVDKYIKIKQKALHKIKVTRLYENKDENNKMSCYFTFIFDGRPEKIDEYDEPVYRAHNHCKDYNSITYYQKDPFDDLDRGRSYSSHEVGRPPMKDVKRNHLYYDLLHKKYIEGQYVSTKVKDFIQNIDENYLGNNSEYAMIKCSKFASFIYKYSNLKKEEIFKLIYELLLLTDIEDKTQLTILRFVRWIILNKTILVLEKDDIKEIAELLDIDAEDHKDFILEDDDSKEYLFEEKENIKDELNFIKDKQRHLKASMEDLTVNEFTDEELYKRIQDYAKEHSQETGEKVETDEGKTYLFVLDHFAHLSENRYQHLNESDKQIVDNMDALSFKNLKRFFNDPDKYMRHTKEIPTFNAGELEEISQKEQKRAEPVIDKVGVQLYKDTLKEHSTKIIEGDRNNCLYIMTSIGLRIGIEKDELIKILVSDLLPRFDGFEYSENDIEYQVNKTYENTVDNKGYFIDEDSDETLEKYFDITVKDFFKRGRSKAPLKKERKKQVDFDIKLNLIVGLFNGEFKSGNHMIYKFDLHGFDLDKTDVNDIPYGVLKSYAEQMSEFLHYKNNLDQNISVRTVKELIKLIKSLRITSKGFNYKDKLDICKDILESSNAFYGDISTTLGGFDNYKEFRKFYQDCKDYVTEYNKLVERFGSLLPDSYTKNSDKFKEIANKTTSESHKNYRDRIEYSSIHFTKQTTKQKMISSIKKQSKKEFIKEIVKNINDKKQDMDLTELVKEKDSNKAIIMITETKQENNEVMTT